MKRYIFDEVETFAEATPVSADSKFKYGFWEEGQEIAACTSRPHNGGVRYLKLTVLEGTEEAIAEAMLVMGGNVLARAEVRNEQA